jgi:hypothetical protein
MRAVTLALWIAGLVELAIAFANFTLPRKLKYQENLSHVTPMVRQIFAVHSAYIVGVVLLFAVITFGFTADLVGGQGLGRFLAAAMALFWFCRVPIQLFYYDPVLRRDNRMGDIAITVALLFLAGTYATAAFFHAA